MPRILYVVPIAVAVDPVGNADFRADLGDDVGREK
jgi:hypothetical protein